LAQTDPDHTNTDNDTPPALRVQLLRASASPPRRHSPLAAGFDLATCLPDAPVELAPGDIALIPTGFAIAIPPHFEGQVRPRSGLATKYGVTVPNAPGTIDADYRGEVFVALINLGKAPFIVEHAMRIAQLVIAPVATPRVEVVDALEATARAQGGFGSTGLV